MREGQMVKVGFAPTVRLGPCGTGNRHLPGLRRGAEPLHGLQKQSEGIWTYSVCEVRSGLEMMPECLWVCLFQG